MQPHIQQLESRQAVKSVRRVRSIPFLPAFLEIFERFSFVEATIIVELPHEQME